MKILKYGRKCRNRRRSKKCGFPLEIQQSRKRCEFQESIVVAKIEYNLGNMKNCENRSTTAKKGNSKKAYNSCCFWRKIDVDAPRRKRGTPRMLMKPVVFEGFWWSQGSKSDDAVRKCEYQQGRMIIWQKWATHGSEQGWRSTFLWISWWPQQLLKSAESRMWTALQTCDKNEGRPRSEKLTDHDQYLRFKARTPSCKQLLGEL